MCNFSASAISSSRKSGCATLINASAFSQLVRPFNERIDAHRPGPGSRLGRPAAAGGGREKRTGGPEHILWGQGNGILRHRARFRMHPGARILQEQQQVGDESLMRGQRTHPLVETVSALFRQPVQSKKIRCTSHGVHLIFAIFSCKRPAPGFYRFPHRCRPAENPYLRQCRSSGRRQTHIPAGCRGRSPDRQGI